MDKNKIKEILKGYNNTRNFSNICTKYGETIRPDIIRSNIITTEEQVSVLIHNDIKTIVDFRISEEGGGESSHPVYPNAIMNYLPIAFGRLDSKKISELLIIGEVEKIDSFIENGYRMFSSDFKHEIKIFFSLLLNKDNLPLVFHCSAGKDRTGIFAALFLFALGVSRNDIINDYMETNNRANIKKLSGKVGEQFNLKTPIDKSIPDKLTKVFELFFMVKSHWIEIFLQEIDKTFGSIDFFLKEEIKVDIEKLKGIYLNNKDRSLT